MSKLNEECNQRANALNCSSKSYCNLLSHNSIQFTLCCKSHQRTACNTLKYFQKIHYIIGHVLTFTFSGAVIDFSVSKEGNPNRPPRPPQRGCLQTETYDTCVQDHMWLSLSSVDALTAEKIKFHMSATKALVTSYACFTFLFRRGRVHGTQKYM